jgi:DnaJ like chaperone protein
MGSFAKWLGASLGWSFGGPIGGILGFVVGTFIDGFSEADLKGYQQRIPQGNGSQSTKSGDFEISLLILSSVVIKADGNIDRRELDFVRQNFVNMFGTARANKAFKLFKGIIKKDNISTRQVCIQIREHMDHAARLQLLHFLFGIAKADGLVGESEIECIRKIAVYLYISNRDFESIKAMFYSKNNTENSYKILEITKAATNDEVKKAYRKMVKKHHPDKVRHLGEEYQQGAEEKFRQIQKAYEQIQKERGI